MAKKDLYKEDLERSAEDLKSRTNKEVVDSVMKTLTPAVRKKVYEDKVEKVRNQIVDAELNLHYLEKVSIPETEKRIEELKQERLKLKHSSARDPKKVKTSKAIIDQMEVRQEKNHADAASIKQNIAEYSLFITRLFEKAKREKIKIDI
jgi:uncharacterized protein (UPF0305 family)